MLSGCSRDVDALVCMHAHFESTIQQKDMLFYQPNQSCLKMNHSFCAKGNIFASQVLLL